MKKTGLKKILSLKQQIAGFLKEQLKGTGTVSGEGQHILIRISRDDFEHRLGNILQQLYRLVEQHFPLRREDLLLLIGDDEGRYENTFKLWRSA